MAQPIIPCALEFIDGRAIDMVRKHSQADIPADAGALLMIEVDGPASAMTEMVEAVSHAASTEGLLSLKSATAMMKSRPYGLLEKPFPSSAQYCAKKD